LLAGWIHYLAFDLFVGAWIATEADRLGLSRLLQAPLLVATFMFGPVGLALFLVMRSGYGAVQTAPAMEART
ncbi:MAG: abscisic acid-deficient protein Aba4 family protein, partial [Pseudomonadota bacterium]